MVSTKMIDNAIAWLLCYCVLFCYLCNGWTNGRTPRDKETSSLCLQSCERGAIRIYGGGLCTILSTRRFQVSGAISTFCMHPLGPMQTDTDASKYPILGWPAPHCHCATTQDTALRRSCIGMFRARRFTSEELRLRGDWNRLLNARHTISLTTPLPSLLPLAHIPTHFSAWMNFCTSCFRREWEKSSRFAGRGLYGAWNAFTGLFFFWKCEYRPGKWAFTATRMAVLDSNSGNGCCGIWY